MSNVRRLRPLTVTQLRAAAANGTLTPEDHQVVSWITRSRTIREGITAAEKIADALAARVRAYREDSHINTKDFAAKCGTTASFISQLECGFKRQMTIATMLRLAEGMGMELDVSFVEKKRSRRAKAR